MQQTCCQSNVEVPPDMHLLDMVLEDSQDAEEISHASQHSSCPQGSRANCLSLEGQIFDCSDYKQANKYQLTI